jgi:hypothetical protein
MLAWFNGYTYGAIYAEQEGVSGWGRIVTSPTLPPYRKKRPPKSSKAVEDVVIPTDEDLPPSDVEPMPAGEAPPAPPIPSAAARRLGNPGLGPGLTSPQSPATGWTGPHDAY